VDVEARVAELGDLLGEELDAVDRVAEDDRLVDGQLAEQRVQAAGEKRLRREGVMDNQKEDAGGGVSKGRPSCSLIINILSKQLDLSFLPKYPPVVAIFLPSL
jgi:hypothetical protein